jgi:putative ABC transport system permease protein
VLSAFKPVSVLKGTGRPARVGIDLRKTLVVFQFTLSILLLIGTFIVHAQVKYMLSQDLGMRTSQVMTLDRPGRWDSARATHNALVGRFKAAVETIPGVEGVGMADESPGKGIRWPTNYRPANLTGAKNIPINTTSIDEHYLDALGLRLLAGRNFSAALATDKKTVILSQSAVDLLGYHRTSDAIGKILRSDDGDYTVVGVVADIHQLSLQTRATPSAFQFGGQDLREYEYYFLKLRPAGMEQTIARVQSAWTAAFRDNPFGYTFLDESFNRQYQSEIRFGTIFSLFSALTIIIACIGLFALVAFMVRQRTKEIGVRKVLGAKVRDVVLLLTGDLARLILIANLIAWPLGWWLMRDWLQDFAYRVGIQWVQFICAGGIAFGVALVTISIQTVRAARANPVKSLRSE